MRHVYVGVEGSLAVRNQLAVRDVLRHDAELRAIAAVNRPPDVDDRRRSLR